MLAGLFVAGLCFTAWLCILDLLARIADDFCFVCMCIMQVHANSQVVLLTVLITDTWLHPGVCVCVHDDLLCVM